MLFSIFLNLLSKRPRKKRVVQALGLKRLFMWLLLAIISAIFQSSTAGLFIFPVAGTSRRVTRGARGFSKGALHRVKRSRYAGSHDVQGADGQGQEDLCKMGPMLIKHHFR